jgi:prolyl 4-hydroxylase
MALPKLPLSSTKTPKYNALLHCQDFKMIGYIFALLPLYVLVYLPISSMLSGSPQKSRKQQALTFNETFIATDEPLSCPSHNYNTHILSHEPLIIYIENFLSESESRHLLEIRYLNSKSLHFWNPPNPDFTTTAT